MVQAPREAKVDIATASFNSLMRQVEEYMQSMKIHDYFTLNEAMVRGTYKDVKHHIQVFNGQ